MRFNRPALENIILIFILAFSPLALGAVHPWSYCTIALLSLILFDIHFLTGVIPSEAEGRVEGSNKLISVLKLPISIGMLLLLGIIAFYIIPLPADFIKIISPKTYELRQTYMLDPTSWYPLSIYTRATVTYLIKFPTYIMLFLVVVSKIKGERGDCPRRGLSPSLEESVPTKAQNYLDRKSSNFILLGALTAILALLFHSLVDFNLQIPANAIYFTVMVAIVTGLTSVSFRARPKAESRNLNYKFLNILVNSIIIIGFLIAVFAILQKLSYNGKIYWLISKPGSHFGPYVNYDHYAGYMEMCLFLAIANFMAKISTSSYPHIKKLKDKIIWFSTKEANTTLIYLFLAVVMATSLFMSTSRGGIMSFCAALLVFYFTCVICSERRKRNRILLASALVILLAVTMIMWVGPEETLNRFQGLNKLIHSIIAERAVLSELRPYMWINTWELIKDHPFWGGGPGCYRYAFTAYRTFPAKWGVLNQAHNDYLQLISEMGLFGWTVVVVFLGWFVRKYRECFRRLREW